MSQHDKSPQKIQVAIQNQDTLLTSKNNATISDVSHYELPLLSYKKEVHNQLKAG